MFFFTLCVMSSCEGEKDLIVSDFKSPIHTKELYLVGDAVPTGWSFEDPTPMQCSETDPYIFVYKGQLHEGEFKVSLAPTSSLDVDFIRPLYYGQEIGEEPLEAVKFQMHADNPDEKWLVVANGTYELTFNLRDWTLSTEYLGEFVQPEVAPIETETLYIVGSATSIGWNIGNAPETAKKSKYIFEYECWLNEGELRATTKRAWGYHIRPVTDHVKIGKDGIENENFMYVWDPDINWLVTDPGNYHLTFDLENWTLKTEFLGGENPDRPSDKDPIETSTLFMVGDATVNGWNGDAMTALTRDASDSHVFTYEGNLYAGEFKVYPKSGDEYPSWDAIRPLGGNRPITKTDITEEEFDYSLNPDYKWVVKDAGKYRLTLNLSKWTMSCSYLGTLEDIEIPVNPIETEEFFILGDAAPSGWDIYNPTPVTRVSKYIFVYDGHLNAGRMRATPVKDWGIHVRPKSDNSPIGINGVASSGFIYTANPDYNWNVEKAGNYKLTFDLEHWTIKAEYKD